MTDPREVLGTAPAATFTVTVDGVPLTAYDGDTLAAVMVRGGWRSWRRTRMAGEARGVFCGIGVCHDCLVTVDGVASVRACIEPARDGDDVRTQEGSGRADLA